jgi:hypothetical protein
MSDELEKIEQDGTKEHSSVDIESIRMLTNACHDSMWSILSKVGFSVRTNSVFNLLVNLADNLRDYLDEEDFKKFKISLVRVVSVIDKMEVTKTNE